MNENDIFDVNGLPAIIVDGVPRVLAKLAPDPVKRAAFPPFMKAAPNVPSGEWREINRRETFPDTWILNQMSHGSCVGFSSAGALMRSRALEGLEYIRLSGAFTYSLINGGRDQGAQISDSLVTLKDVGTCTEAEAPWTAIYPHQYPASARETAKRFRVLEAYKVDTFEELMSGIQLGFIGVGAVMVGSRFTTLNSDGVAGFDGGPGNHAVAFDGAHRLGSGVWTVDMPNSWGLGFGQSGRCYITERHIESVQQDCYLIRAATDDPKAPQPPEARA